MKICCTCNESKPFDDFSRHKESLDGRQYKCKKCTRAYSKRHYENNKQNYVDSKKRHDKKYFSEVNSMIIDYLLSHACVDCGEDDILVLEFDHLYDKKAEICGMRSDKKNIELIKAEIKKCEVRCCNCHRRKTQLAVNSYKVRYLAETIRLAD